MKEVYVLFSGGKESLVNMYEALRRKEQPILVLYNYGQASYSHERKAIEYYTKKFSLNRILLDLPGMCLPPGIGGDTKSKNDQVIMRNVLFTAHLFSHVGRTNVKVLIGACKYPKGVYNDGCTYFLEDFNRLVRNLYPKCKVDSYAKKVDSDKTYRLLLDKDISHLRSCASSSKKPCGKCKKCKADLKVRKRKSGKEYLRKINLL